MTTHPRNLHGFVKEVMQHLDGTYDEHPVQFDWIAPGLVACTVCGAAVNNSDRWTALHRQNHDDHNKVHEGINDQARRYIPPPRYG